ncbi:MAG: BREX-1 system adenine-specific DNA-methyltransferase PglX, partial [Desulfamplus sp.]|nr:BREX-1 system adenine-specific DNA-methyltransferase PglX [Desulfamplus sp.]
METSKLKNFAQHARRALREIVQNKLKLVLAKDSTARREQPKAVEKLEQEISSTSMEQVIEKVAYIWFNRFCALRFMDVNRYNRTSVLSPLEGQFQPEILTEVKMGVIDDTIIPQETATKILDLIQNKIPSADPQNEAYRLIVVAVCNHLNTIMPFLFQRIADYTELLMPDDLLSGNSIISYVREAMTPDACKDVEVIGWLYQFYISEKKDEVFAGLKKNKKVTPENIPAATQLFTPSWIVRYLVENSLGRLWMLNNPNSRLIDRMEYYIKPEQEETDFLLIKSPEEIKICDPACGSGHMLVYAFEILYAIYEEEGYDAPTIPTLILENNLYGIEIDERAGELAAFALCMKAREKYRRFFKKSVQPNICVLENITFEDREVKSYLEAVNPDLFSEELSTLLYQFKEASNFGSLIQPVITDIQSLLNCLEKEEKSVFDDLFLQKIHDRVLTVLKQADYLSPKYHVILANPPYMGSKGMNGSLGKWVKGNFPNSKSDLFAVFIERNLELTREHGFVGMITMQSWMFLSSYEKLRDKILTKNTILSMAHIGARGFDSIGGEVVSTTAFVLKNSPSPEFKGHYVRLVDGNSEQDKYTAILEVIQHPDCGWFFTASSVDFKKIPGSPVAYWVSKKIRQSFSVLNRLGHSATTRKGMVTGDNSRFTKFWYEVDFAKIGFSLNNRSTALSSDKKWFPYIKGGGFRKWFGNVVDVVLWENDGEVLRNIKHPTADRPLASNFNLDFIFKPNVSWGTVSSSEFSARLSKGSELFDQAGNACFSDEKNLNKILCFLNSKVSTTCLNALNPTMNFVPGDIASLPLTDDVPYDKLAFIFVKIIHIAQSDWNSSEVSWGFKQPIINPEHHGTILHNMYTKIRIYWQQMIKEMQLLEQENNRIFIEAYGLKDELTPDVPLHEITLTCNPHYRYAQGKTEEAYETLLKADTMKELISYSVGCMMGRYSLDEPGLIYAHSG